MNKRGMEHAAGWTPERIDQVTRLWADGNSAGEIARIIGGGATRNGVIGKVTRLKLPQRRTVNAGKMGGARPGAGRPHGNKGQPKVNAIVAAAASRRKAPTPPPMDAEPFDMEDGPGNDVTSLIGIMENSGCKWITGDPLGKHGYCGQPFKAGSDAWCPDHYAIVYPWGRAR